MQLSTSPKTRLGPYRLIKCVYTDDTSEYWSAEHHTTNVRAMLQVLKSYIASDREFVTMLAETQLDQITFKHPNLIHIHSICGDAEPYLVLENLRWVPLHDALGWLPSSTPLDPVEAVDIVEQVCRALTALQAHMHNAGNPNPLVYRNVSSHALMLDDNGCIRLFPVSSTEVYRRIPRMGVGVTDHTMFESLSPEAARGDELTPASDVFALGSLLYTLSVGQHPFLDKSSFQTLVNIVQGPIVWPSIHQPGFDSELEAIILRALERDLSRRYATPELMMLDLQAYLDARLPWRADCAELDINAGLGWVRTLMPHAPLSTALLLRDVPLLGSSHVVLQYIADHMATEIALVCEGTEQFYPFTSIQRALLMRRLEPVRQKLVAQPPSEPLLCWLLNLAEDSVGDAMPDSLSAETTAEPTAVSLGSVSIHACAMQWDHLSPAEGEDPDEVRHCSRCDQCVTRVESPEAIIPLAGNACVFYDP